MKKLDLFRWFAEGYADTHNTDPKEYFQTFVEQMYPKNLHRRGWALDNLYLFYYNRMGQLRIERDILYADT